MEHSIISKIVKASGIKPGELVLVQFWGEDSDIAIMHSFATAVASLGASPVELQQSAEVNAERFAAADKNAFDERYFTLFAGFDAVLDVFNHPPAPLAQENYIKYMASMFKALSGAVRFIQLRLPSLENALDSGLPPKEFAARMYAAYDVDYQRLAQKGGEMISALSKRDSVTVFTENNCKLHFKLRGRKWYLDAGNGDLPCGEVYVAPVEAETNGAVYFEKLYADEWSEFNNITLMVKKGIISANNVELQKHLDNLVPSDKTVCELGFGINPNVTDLCGYTALDEKADGTFHIAIGDNTLFGGKNKSRKHVDFVGQMAAYSSAD